MRHLRVSCLCFCWMPTITSPKLHGQSRSVSTAAKKPHSTASAWENFCGTTICKRRTHTFQWKRLFLDPSPILRPTLRVFRLLFMLTDVVHCTTTERDCNWQRPRGEGIIAPFSVSFSISLRTAYKNKLTQGALFAQDRTTLLTRVEEACRHDEDWTHLTVTDFWAKLNQVLVDAGADLYARETKAKISTPQDTLDARHDMTKAKLDVMKLPPRRPKN